MTFKVEFISICCVLIFTNCHSQSPAVRTATPSVIASDQIQSRSITSTNTMQLTVMPISRTETALNERFIAMKETQQYYNDVIAPATLTARKVHCKEDYYPEMYFEILRMSTEKWTIFTCSPKTKYWEKWTPGKTDYGKRYTQLVSVDLSKTWIIQHNAFDYSIINRPDALLLPYRWTGDGTFLFLFPSYFPGGSGFAESDYLQTHVNSLYRINLSTGIFDLIISKLEYGALSISPDDSMLIYSEQDEQRQLHIRQLVEQTETLIQVNEDIKVTGGFVWNSNSTEVVFFIGYGNQTEDWQEDLSGTAIYLLSIRNSIATKIAEKDERNFIPHKCPNNSYWLDENTICIYSMNNYLESGHKLYSLNVRTKIIQYIED